MAVGSFSHMSFRFVFLPANKRRFDANVREFDSLAEKVYVEYCDGICEWVHTDICRAVTSRNEKSDDRSISETLFKEEEKSVSTFVEVNRANASDS